MTLGVKVSQKFLNMFSHLGRKQCSQGISVLDVFILDIRSNRFVYDNLVNELYDIIITYALSNSRLSEYEGSYGGKAFVEARNKLRDYVQNDGELGEILLYSFLESHLQAPKLLSKLEIKTSANDYVKGSDGVHLLSLSDNEHKIVFGESKMRKQLLDGVSDAFRSIKKFADSKLAFETTLIDSQLIKTSVTQDEYLVLKKILLPTEGDDDMNTDYSFGAFVGYEVAVSNEEKKLPNREYRELLYERVKQQALDSFENVLNAIDRHELHGYNFYIYIVPFTEIDETRKLLLKRIAEA